MKITDLLVFTCSCFCNSSSSSTFTFSEKLTDGVEVKTESKEKSNANMPDSLENTLGDAEVFIFICFFVQSIQIHIG